MANYNIDPGFVPHLRLFLRIGVHGLPTLGGAEDDQGLGVRVLGSKVQDDLSVYAVEKGPRIELFTDIQTGQP